MQRLTAQARQCSDVVTRSSRPQSGSAACVVPSQARHAAATTAAAAAAATPRQQPQQRPCVARQQLPTQRHRCRMQIATAAAAVDGAPSSTAVELAEEEEEEVSATAAVNSIVQYALSLAKASQAYEVHSWVLLLGILKLERCTAAKLLQKLGLEDLYGAWNEVLWAINACDGLKPKAATSKIGFTDKAFKVMNVSMYYANCAGRTVVQTEDLLLALAAGDVLTALFPDLGLTAQAVRTAIETYTETTYVMEGEEEGDGASSGDESVKADESIFL